MGAGGSSLLVRVRRLCGIEPMQRSWAKFIAGSLVLLIGAGVLGFPWRAIADEEDKKEFDMVTIKLIGDTGENESANYRIDVPHVGYPGAGKAHRTLQPNEDGVFSVSDFDSGVHSLMVRDAGTSGYWKHSFTLDLPNQKQHIEIPAASFAGVPKADPENPQPIQIEKLTVRNGDWDIRCKIVTEILNKGSKPWPIGDFSNGALELICNEYRVFVPNGMIQPKGEIGSRRTYDAQIDWPKLVSEGLWLRRDYEDNSKGTSETLLPDDELHLGFRMSLWGQTTEPFQLPHPETILAGFAAMEKAKSRLEFALPSYFIGEHMPVNYIVLNEGEQDIRVGWGGDSRAPRPLRFKIVATKNGRRVPDPYPNPFCAGGMGSVQTVEPGGEYDMGTLALQSYCTFTEPGTYQIQAWHDLEWEAGQHYSQDAPVSLTENFIPLTKTRAPIATATLVIKSPTEEQAANVVMRMRQNFAGGYLSGKVFSSLRINAYLPSLRKWIDENGGKLEHQDRDRHEAIYGRTAIVGIGGIWTPEATAMLVELLNHEDNVVVRDALRQLALRMPNRNLEARYNAAITGTNDSELPALSSAQQSNYLRAKKSWRTDFRKPILNFALKTLADPNLPAAQTGEKPIPKDESDRLARIRAAQLLSAVARQDDYPQLRQTAERVIREYRDDADEQSAYPRPQTVTASLTYALWYSFNNGNAKYAPQQSSEFVFDTQNLEQLFAAGQIDEFTTATLLKSVESFRPDGWKTWVLKQLRSDLPWMRCHMMQHLPDPNDEDVRKAIARNIGHYLPTVQAAALTVAEKSPAKIYLPELKRAVENGNKEIKPLVEAALKACESLPKDDDDQSSAEELSLIHI